MTVKITRHGPVMNDFMERLEKKNPIAMSWTYTREPIQILDAAYGLSHAKNTTDFKNLSA